MALRSRSYSKKKSEDRESRNNRGYRGGSSSRKSGGEGNSEFQFITGLFETKKGGSYTVFLKPDHIEKLQALKEGDMIGISESKSKDNMVNLWFREAEQ